MSGGPASDDPHYKARLRDVLLRVLTSVLSKMGSLGGTLGMALESRKTMKRIQTGDTHAELTWQELMEESMDYLRRDECHPTYGNLLPHSAGFSGWGRQEGWG